MKGLFIDLWKSNTSTATRAKRTSHKPGLQTLTCLADKPDQVVNIRALSELIYVGQRE